MLSCLCWCHFVLLDKLLLLCCCFRYIFVLSCSFMFGCFLHWFSVVVMLLFGCKVVVLVVMLLFWLLCCCFVYVVVLVVMLLFWLLCCCFGYVVVWLLCCCFGYVVVLVVMLFWLLCCCFGCDVVVLVVMLFWLLCCFCYVVAASAFKLFWVGGGWSYWTVMTVIGHMFCRWQFAINSVLHYLNEKRGRAIWDSIKLHRYCEQ